MRRAVMDRVPDTIPLARAVSAFPLSPSRRCKSRTVPYAWFR